MAKFVTNQNIEIDLELGSLGERIIAFILDVLLIFVFVMIATGLLSLIEVNEWALTLIFIPLMFYSIAFEYFGNGQTPGKRAMNIKVTRLDGSTPSISHYLIRWLFRIVDIWLYPVMFAPAVISIIATKNGQRIGDIIAGTTVIKVRQISANQAFQTVIPEDHKITYSGVKMLNDDQIELIKKALKRRKEGYSDEGVKVLVEKIKTKLNIESNDPDVKFLYTIIKDYEFLANQTF
ncbi:RDD family protein [Ekhidna sp.]|uniref:RDD family protein n=1 Tax=Ekhidna sp. TaxID=2608089 RepID=UPI003B505109